MKNEKYINKKQLLEEFGLSRSTFYRLIRQENIPVSRRLLSPAEAERLRAILRGYTAGENNPDKWAT